MLVQLLQIFLFLLLLKFCIWTVDYLQTHCKGSTMYGFRGGPAGVMKGKYVVLTPEFIYPYRNQVCCLAAFFC